VKSNWALGCITPDRYPDGNAVQQGRERNVGHWKGAETVPANFIDRIDMQESAIVGRFTGEGDLALVAAAQDGNLQAFEVLVERHGQKIFFVARRITGTREDAEDVVQQTFQKAFTYLCKFENRSSFSTGLTRIAINEALMMLRRGRRLREIAIDDSSGNGETAMLLEIPDSGLSPESSYWQRERERMLSAAMNKLTPGVRTAIELRELAELSTGEIARRMGLSVEAVKGRLFHGRKKLRKTLKCYVESAWA
jgi:RNA polymerase sigma-70 factor (ECF subfamily)